jgi:hypothetical protein
VPIIESHCNQLKLGHPLTGNRWMEFSLCTVSKFQKGFFLGLTLNLTGFVQSVFGGGGGGAAK